MLKVTEQRRKWEDKYRNQDLSEFRWYSPDLPSQLLELLKRDDVPPGGALDVGCGPGHITVGLASRFSPAVGFDIAESAVAQAKAQRLPDTRRPPAFLVAAAPDMPFRGATFSLVFDRGCLQAVPEGMWPEYLSEVERLLKPGGMYMVFASRPAPPLLSLGAVKNLIKRVTRGGRRLSIAARLRRDTPASLKSLEVQEVRWSERIRRQDQTYALFRKDGAPR